MVETYNITVAVKNKIKANGYVPHNRSRVMDTVTMGKLINLVAAKMTSMGYTNEDVQQAFLNETKHLCAAWRGMEENANYIVEHYVDCPHGHGDANPIPGDGHSNGGGDGDDGWDPKRDQNGDGNNDGSGDQGQNGDGQGQGHQDGGDGDGDGSNGKGGFDGDGDDGDGDGDGGDGGDGDGDDNDDEKEGDDGFGGKDKGEGDDEDDNDTPIPGPVPVPPVPPVPGPQGHDDDEYPEDPDYEPPSIWFKVIRIIKWNLVHPGEQKNIMLVGPKGIGKTKLMFEASRKMFGKVPYMVTAPQMEFKICGFNDAMGNEVKTPITRGYVDEDGAIIGIDEIDRMDPGAGIQLNMATANKYMDGPNGILKMSDKVTFIATANTSGTGATNDYNTANQLDASSRDRWVYLLMEWDHKVAVKVAKGDESLVAGLEDWNRACDKIQYTAGLLSYRTITDIIDLLDMGCFTFEEAIQAAMLKYAIPKSNLSSIYDQMEDKYNKVAKAVRTIMEEMPDNDNLF